MLAKRIQKETEDTYLEFVGFRTPGMTSAPVMNKKSFARRGGEVAGLPAVGLQSVDVHLGDGQPTTKSTRQLFHELFDDCSLRGGKGNAD